MSFDAGSIIARAEVDQSKFSRDLDAMESRVRRFEAGPHKIRITASVQQSDLTRARQMFARFDQQLFQDAVQRQRAGRGLLAGLFGRAVPGTSGATMFGGLVGGSGSAGTAQAEQQVRAEMARLDQKTAQDAAQRQSLMSRVSVRLGGGGGGGGLLSRLLSQNSGGGGGSPGLTRGLFSGIGPQILGIGLRPLGLATLGPLALGALPALLGPLAGLGVAGAGLGFAGLAAKSLIGTKNVAGHPATQGPLFQAAQTAKSAMESAFRSSASVLVDPLRSAFKQVPHLIRSIAPDLRAAFAGAGTLIMPLLHGLADLAHMVLPALGKAFRAAAPLLRPMIDGIGALVKGLLPGLTTLLRASLPAVHVFAQIFAMIGNDIGKMLSLMAPVIRQSAVIFRALSGVIGALFPIVGKLAAIFASTLAPVFAQLARVIRSLLPFLTIFGRVLAALAGAVLGDLVSAFTALARLMVDLAPSFTIVAKAFSQLFAVLENSGVFAVLGNALEKLVPVIALFINTLVRQLAPILPQLISLLAQFASVMVTLLAAGLSTVLKGLTLLIRRLPFLVPLLGTLTAAWIAFNVVLAANPIGLIIVAIGALIGAVTLLATHWSAVWGAIKTAAGDAWHFIDRDVIHPMMGAFNGVRRFIEVWALRVAVIFAGWAENILHYAQDAFGWLPNFIPGAAGIKAGLAAAHADLANFVSSTQATLAKLTGKSYPLKFTIKLPPGAVTSTPGARSGGAPTRPGFAGGTRGAAPGWAWTGEQGPELVHFHGGEAVLTNRQSMAVSRGFAAGTGGLTVHLAAPSIHAIASTLGSIVSSAVAAVRSHYIVPATMLGGGGGGGFGGHGVIPTGPIQAYARRLVGAVWPGLGQWLAFADIVARESGWNVSATNPSSGAYGIPQALPGGKMASAGADWRTNPFTQVRWMVGYIKDRWIDPIRADFNERIAHWYDRGGWMRPGYPNGTGQPEAVLTPGESSAFVALSHAAAALSSRNGSASLDDLLNALERLISAVQDSSAQTAAGVGSVLNGVARGARQRGGVF